MSEFLRGFLDNESTFGRLMTRCGIVIGANLMFVLFSMPVVTAGASFVALYHVMLKTLRGDGVINPFKQFWIGFKNNFKQATIYWIILLILVFLGYVDVTFCRQVGGVFEYFMYAIYALGIVALVITLILFPTMAAFADTIPHLMRNALYFAVQKPFRLLVILFFNVFPMYLTYTDAQMQPLYAFLWCTCGFGAVALLGSTLLLPSFQVYLPAVDAAGDFILDQEEEDRWGDGNEAVLQTGGDGQHEKSQAELLKEMKKLGM
jgi:uncharacterized membrane protein YesL